MALLVSGLALGNAAQTTTGSRESDPPPTAGAQGKPVRIRSGVATATTGGKTWRRRTASRPRRQGRPGQEKTRDRPGRGSGDAGGCTRRQLARRRHDISRRRRSLFPPEPRSGRKFELCFAFSSWRDSLTSAQAILGAKPNHGFFYCQHPDAKKIPARGAVADRATRPASCAARDARRDGAARCATAFGRKRFFSAVLFPRSGRATTTRVAPGASRRRRAARMKGGESASCDVGRSGPDFASHKPGCADLRERCATGNGVARASARLGDGVRSRVRGVRRRLATTRKPMRRTRKKPPADADGSRSLGRAATPRRADAISGPRPRAARRSRPGRAVR